MNTKGNNMKKIFVLSVLALTGCASIVDGGPDTINLMTSNGASVKAQINSKQFGTQQITLPTFITVPKSCSDITVNVMEDKKVNQSSAIVSSSVNPWIFGNVVFGGLIGLAVDGAAGNMCTYDSSVIVPISSK